MSRVAQWLLLVLAAGMMTGCAAGMVVDNGRPMVNLGNDAAHFRRAEAALIQNQIDGLAYEQAWIQASNEALWGDFLDYRLKESHIWQDRWMRARERRPTALMYGALAENRENQIKRGRDLAAGYRSQESYLSTKYDEKMHDADVFDGLKAPEPL